MKTNLSDATNTDGVSTKSTGVSPVTSKARTQHTHGIHNHKKPVTYILFIAVILALALFNPDSAIAFGTPFANSSASAHCPLRSTHHKVRLGKVQCAPARSLCEIRPKPIAEFGFNIILLGERFMYLPPVPLERVFMLKNGMSKDEVSDILGIPSEQKNNDQGSTWYYCSWVLWNFFQIEFSQDGKVISYSMED